MESQLLELVFFILGVFLHGGCLLGYYNYWYYICQHSVYIIRFIIYLHARVDDVWRCDAKCRNNCKFTYRFQILLDFFVWFPAVLGTAYEPIAGWTNDLNNLTGCALGSGLGLVRVFHGPSCVNAEIVPVDMLVNLMLVACWDSIGNRCVRICSIWVENQSWPSHYFF